MERIRQWLWGWLVPRGQSWYQLDGQRALSGVTENHTRILALESRSTALEAVLKDREAAASLSQWDQPDMDAHLGAN